MAGFCKWLAFTGQCAGLDQHFSLRKRSGLGSLWATLEPWSYCQKVFAWCFVLNLARVLSVQSLFRCCLGCSITRALYEACKVELGLLNIEHCRSVGCLQQRNCKVLRAIL